MSMWGFARNATKTYLRNLNATAAREVLNKSRITGRMAGTMGLRGGFGSYGSRRIAQSTYWNTFGKGMGDYFWRGANASERAIRLGTAGGGALLAGNFLNPRDNWGPF